MIQRRQSLCVALALSVALTAGAAFAQAPIKIGFMAELSGPQGALGQDQYDAFMMVVERNGGKLGGVVLALEILAARDEDQCPLQGGIFGPGAGRLTH